MKHLTPILLALFVLAPLMPAQPRTQLKRQLRSMISKAKNDTTKLFEAASFAKENNFTADYKRLISKILKIDKEHAGANAAIGKVKYEGEWISEADYKKKIAAKLEAEFKAAGKVKVGGVWVSKEHVADAKQGVFHHDGRLANKWEMEQFQSGKVRHPRTGQFIETGDLKKAEEGLVPLPDGRWVSVKDADKFHSDKARPWTIRTKYCYLIGTIPLDELDAMASVVDVAAASALKIFGGDPPPTRIAAIQVAKTTDDYKDIGVHLGGGDDSYGIYIASGNGAASRKEIEGGESRLVIMNYGVPDARKFYGRHAAGLAMCCSLLGDDVGDVPAWFLRGVGAYSSQHLRASDAKWYAKQHKEKGGVGDLRDWFGDFKISMDISAAAVDANIFQAGLLIAFCLKGGDKTTTEALMKVTEACKKGGKVGPAVENLQKVLINRQTQVKAYFEGLLK